MKIAIFFTAGIGNIALTIPMLKQLKKEGKKITGVFTSNREMGKLLKGNGLLDEIICQNNFYSLFLICVLKYRSVEIVYLDFFASTRKNSLLALIMGKKVISNKSELKPFFRTQKIKFIEPLEKIHESKQYLRLAKIDKTVVLEDFSLDISIIPNTQKTKLKYPYIVIQFSAGNNKAEYKNWPIPYWIELIKLINNDFENCHIMLLGDKNETNSAKVIEKSGCKNIVNLVGKTSLNDILFLLKNSVMYVGLDSGLMHLAITQQTPIFCIWGGSDETMFSYKSFESDNYCIMQNKLYCHPCNSWLKPNTKKVTDPNLCDNFECLNSISYKQVYSMLNPFLNGKI